jgi:hypothetical protein
MRIIEISAAALLLTVPFVLPPAAAAKALVEVHEVDRDGVVRVRATPPDQAMAGWQAVINQPVPAGHNLIFSYKCPTGTKPVNGSFFPNSTARAGLSLVGNYYLKAQMAWGWAINWPSGAPTGSTILFTIYCTP